MQFYIPPDVCVGHASILIKSRMHAGRVHAHAVSQVLIIVSACCDAVAEMELSKAADAKATGVWMDSTASHVICAVTSANAAEAHYAHARWQKSRVLGKLRGILLACVAWDLVKGNESSTGCVRDMCMHACMHGSGQHASTSPNALECQCAFAMPALECQDYALSLPGASQL